jgi:6-pyruvoyl-tetrahydropterin synthase
MVIDFLILNQIVQKKIINKHDHSLVLNAESPHNDISGLNEHFEKSRHTS